MEVPQWVDLLEEEMWYKHVLILILMEVPQWEVIVDVYGRTIVLS